MNEHGKKTILGIRFSHLLRKIGNEITEECGEELVSKVESLARKMWDLALGYKEEVWVRVKGSDCSEMKLKIHKPDTAILKELLERIDGKAGDNKTRPVKPAAERVREQTRDRINALGGKSNVRAIQ